MIKEAIIDEIKSQFLHDHSGHDWQHIERVYKMAVHIQSEIGGDLEVVELAALLHDISDHKMNGGKLNDGGNVAREILSKYEISSDKIEHVCSIIDSVSYKGANVADSTTTLEAKIVQDADRLDAIGAIGIARAFAYGGNKNRPMYVPEMKAELHDSFEAYANAEGHTINHFYEKLLLLKDRLHTPTARNIGEKRHQIMLNFLSDFYAEWNSEIDN